MFLIAKIFDFRRKIKEKSIFAKISPAAQHRFIQKRFAAYKGDKKKSKIFERFPRGRSNVLKRFPRVVKCFEKRKFAIFLGKIKEKSIFAKISPAAQHRFTQKRFATYKGD